MAKQTKLVSRLKRLSSIYRRQQCEPEPDSEPTLVFTSSVYIPKSSYMSGAQGCHESILASGSESEHEAVYSHRSSASWGKLILLDGCEDLSSIIAPESPQPRASQHVNTTPSWLEELPSDIQLGILASIPDLPTLRALVHASPKFHRVYARNRLRILRDCVTRSIGSDAHAAYLTGTESFRRSDITTEVIRDFIGSYKACRNSNAPSPTLASAGVRLEDYAQLARFHLSVIEPLTERYALWALAALGSSPVIHPLSETETRRIQRAMYRLETFCNLCSERSPCQIWGALDRLDILSSFHAWEVEEMLCIHEFAKERIGSVFHQVAAELLSTLKLRYSRTLVNGHGAVEGDMQNYLLSYGLTPLLALFETADTDELAEVVRRYLDDVYFYASHRDDWLDGKLNENIINTNGRRSTLADKHLAISKDAQDSRRRARYADVDADRDSEQEMRFEKDSTGSPPLAWVLYCDGSASDLFGDVAPASFRRWGYVMWDAHRLDNGARAYIRSQRPSKYI